MVSLPLGIRLRFRSRLSHLSAKCVQPGLVLSLLGGGRSRPSHWPSSMAPPCDVSTANGGRLRSVPPARWRPPRHVGGHHPCRRWGCGVRPPLAVSQRRDDGRDFLGPLDDVSCGGVFGLGVAGDPALASPAINNDPRQPEHQQAQQYGRPAGATRPNSLRHAFPEP